MYSTDSSITPGKGPDESIASRKSHRKTAVIITLSVLATAIVIPFAVGAASDDSDTNSNNTKPAADTIRINATSKSTPLAQPDSSTKDSKPAQQPSDDNSSQTSVTVNGQSVEVPANGSYSKTTTDGNGQTQVNVDSSHQQTSSGSSGSVSNQSSSNVNVNVHSESNSETSDE